MKPTKLNELRVQHKGMYHVKVSLFDGNPPFWCILLVGFVDANNNYSNYTKLVGTDIDEIEGNELHGVVVHECLYICQQRESYS